MSHNTGGPAFPCTEANYADPKWTAEGISIRDYFAAKADIPWEVAAEIVYRLNGNHNGTPMDIMKQRAIMRYVQADEMLAERTK